MTTNTKANRYTNDFVWPLNERQSIVKNAQFDREVDGLREAFAYWLMEVAKERWADSLTTASPPLLLMDQIVYWNEDLDTEIEKYKQEARDMLDAPHVAFDFDEKYLGYPSSFTDEVYYKEYSWESEEKIIKVLWQHIYTEVVDRFVEHDSDFDTRIIYFWDEVYDRINLIIKHDYLHEDIQIQDIDSFLVKYQILINTVSEEIIIYFQDNFEKYKVQREAWIRSWKEAQRSFESCELFTITDRKFLFKKLSKLLLSKYSIDQIEWYLDDFKFTYEDDLLNIEKELKELFKIEKNEDNILELAEKREKLEKLLIRIWNEWKVLDNTDINNLDNKCDKSFEDLYQEYIKGTQTIEARYAALEIIILWFIDIIKDEQNNDTLWWNNKKVINDLNNVLSLPLSKILSTFRSELNWKPELQIRLQESTNIKADLEREFPFLLKIELGIRNLIREKS